MEEEQALMAFTIQLQTIQQSMVVVELEEAIGSFRIPAAAARRAAAAAPAAAPSRAERRQGSASRST